MSRTGQPDGDAERLARHPIGDDTAR